MKKYSRPAGPAMLLLLFLNAGQACSQNSTAGTATPAAAQPAAATSAAPADPQIDSFKELLAGSWSASGREPATGEDAGFWMHIAPVTIDGIDNAMYVEQCRADDPTLPYRQAIFQVYRNRGKIRLRTLEFRLALEAGGPWGQTWLVPDLFPGIFPEDLIATLDLEFAPSAGGFDGKTPYPYPNADNGAVEMTSEMKVSQDKLVTTDKGYGADGKVVWSTSGGSASPESLTWARADSGFKVQRDEDGLVILTLQEAPEGAAAAVDGDTMFLDYALFLADGMMVDASSRSGRLLPMSVPQTPGGGMIPGFFRGVADAPQGTVRRLIIPPALGYGENGRQSIPGDSTLYFRVEVNEVQKPVPPPEAQEPAPEGDAGGEKPADGGGH